MRAIFLSVVGAAAQNFPDGCPEACPGLADAFTEAEAKNQEISTGVQDKSIPSSLAVAFDTLCTEKTVTAINCLATEPKCASMLDGMQPEMKEFLTGLKCMCDICPLKAVLKSLVSDQVEESDKFIKAVESAERAGTLDAATGLEISEAATGLKNLFNNACKINPVIKCMEIQNKKKDGLKCPTVLAESMSSAKAIPDVAGLKMSDLACVCDICPVVDFMTDMLKLAYNAGLTADEQPDVEFITKPSKETCQISALDTCMAEANKERAGSCPVVPLAEYNQNVQLDKNKINDDTCSAFSPAKVTPNFEKVDKYDLCTPEKCDLAEFSNHCAYFKPSMVYIMGFAVFTFMQ